MSIEFRDSTGGESHILLARFGNMKDRAGEVELLGKTLAIKHLRTLEKGFEAAKLGSGIDGACVVMTLKDQESGALNQVSVRCDELAQKLGVKTAEVVKATKSPETFEQWIREQLEPTPVVSAGAAERGKKNLAELGLKPEEYQVICQYYEKHREELQTLEKPTHIRKDSENKLPRSLVYNPAPPHKGLHILCKSHSGAPEIGLGSFNRATLMLHVDTGEKKVFRNGLKKDIYPQELKANIDYAKIDPEGKYFATGVPVEYTGPWRPREKPRERNQPETKADRKPGPLEKGYHEKVGLIMDFIPGGELWTKIDPAQEGNPYSQKERLEICLHIAEGMKLAHAAGLVNFDNKPENIFLKGKTPLQADFGMVEPEGKIMMDFMGTPGYLSPELINYGFSGKYFEISPANEMWIMGCIMAWVFRGGDFANFAGQQDVKNGKNFKNVADQTKLARALQTLFPNNRDPGHIDHAIAGCLQYDPKNRLSAEQLVSILEDIREKL